MGVYDLLLTGPRTADLGLSWIAGRPFLCIFEVQKRHLQNRQKHYKNYGFGNMRVQDGAKMPPKSALFFYS